MMEQPKQHVKQSWRKRLNTIIFEADTPAGKTFDVLLLWAILISIIVIMLDSVRELREMFGTYFYYLEWGFTILFTIEYFLRIVVARKPLKYLTSFYGLIDLLSILPTYISYFFAGPQYLMVVRGLRLLRIFRILKLRQFQGQAKVLRNALKLSMPKITVFLGTVIMVVIIIGTLMYVIEGPESGFTSIPLSMYWAVVTMTTVGYGDIIPHTDLGKFLASLLMITGYGIIAIPTGIVSVELARADRKGLVNQMCPGCAFNEHDDDALHCKRCGSELIVLDKDAGIQKS